MHSSHILQIMMYSVLHTYLRYDFVKNLTRVRNNSARFLVYFLLTVKFPILAFFTALRRLLCMYFKIPFCTHERHLQFISSKKKRIWQEFLYQAFFMQLAC